MLLRSVVSVTGVASNVSTEGVVATLPPVPLPNDPSGLLVQATVIDGFLNFTAGAGTTAVVVRVRRGSLAGAQVGPNLTHTLAAAAIGSVAVAVNDTPLQATPPNEGQVYVVTIQQTGGTGAGSTNYAVFTATMS